MTAPQLATDMSFKVTLALLVATGVCLAQEERPKRMFQDMISDAEQLLAKESIQEVEAVIDADSLGETMALRTAFSKVPHSDFKGELLLLFLAQDNGFWGNDPLPHMFEAKVAFAMTVHVMGYLEGQFGIEVDGTMLLSSVDGLADVARMIRAKLGGDKQQSPPAMHPSPPLSALVPADSGKPPAPDTQPAVVADAQPGRLPWLLMMIAALAAVGCVGILVRSLLGGR